MSKINQNWIFGDKSGLNFANSNANTMPTPISSLLEVGTSEIHNEGCASISDNNGNLLFYTNGIKVWKVVSGVHSVLNIPDLKGHSSSTQSSIIVPDPANSYKYYIFTADSISSGSAEPYVHAYLLDTSTWLCPEITNIYSLASQKSNYVHTEKITAIQKPDSKGFWVITIVYKNPSPKSLNYEGFFRVWEVDSSGTLLPLNEITMNVFYPPPPLNFPLPFARGGYLKGSPNGQMLANANGNHVVVYAFDNSTGDITTPGRSTVPHTDPKEGVYGVEFSSNSKNLFYGNLARPPKSSDTDPVVSVGRIFHVDVDLSQVDLTQTTPLLNWTQVGADIPNPGANDEDNDYAIGALQLAVNGLIYFAKDYETQLGAIENPDDVSGFTITNSALSTPLIGNCRLGLPNLLPNPCKEGPCDCGCAGCNENAEEQNEDLIKRAQTKFNVIKSKKGCGDLP